MLHCDTVKQMLSSYLEDAIEPDLKAQFQSHLEACPTCKKVYLQVRSITQRLHSVSSIKTASNFDQKLRAQILSDKQIENPVISVRNLSYGLSGLVVIAGVYFISTADILKFNNSGRELENNQTISKPQPVQSAPGIAQPVSNEIDGFAADTLKSSPTTLEERDLKLIKTQ